MPPSAMPKPLGKLQPLGQINKNNGSGDTSDIQNQPSTISRPKTSRGPNAAIQSKSEESQRKMRNSSDDFELSNSEKGSNGRHAGDDHGKGAIMYLYSSENSRDEDNDSLAESDTPHTSIEIPVFNAEDNHSHHPIISNPK